MLAGHHQMLMMTTPVSSWYISCGITKTQNKGRGGDIFCGNRSSAGAKHIYWSTQPKRKRRKSKKEEIWMERKASGAVLFYMLFYRRRRTKKKWDAYYIIWYRPSLSFANGYAKQKRVKSSVLAGGPHIDGLTPVPAETMQNHFPFRSSFHFN